MNTFYLKSLFILCITSCSLSALAQDTLDVEEVTIPKKSYFRAAANYLSNAVSYGRKDSARVPYISASIGYFHKSGTYISSSISYLASTVENRVDLFSIEGGYSLNIGSNVSMGAYASKSFYNASSFSVSSEIKSSVGSNIT